MYQSGQVILLTNPSLPPLFIALCILFTKLIDCDVDIRVTNTTVFQLESHVILRGVVTFDLDLLESGGGVLLGPGGGGVHAGEDCRQMSF